MASIHYKFRATIEKKTLQFDGLQILGSEVKREICAKENIKAEAFELLLQNAQTKRNYKNDDLIPRNSYIIVQRVPKEDAEKLPKIQGVNMGMVSKADATVDSGINVTGHINQSEFEQLPEDEALAHVRNVSTSKYQASNFQRRTGSSILIGPPPPTYVCNRCSQPGHWFKNCPMLNTKRTTGIPSQELMETTADDPLAMLHPSGKHVIPIMHWKARQHKKNVEESPVGERVHPPEFTCPICFHLMKDAVLTTCCGNSFCSECISQRLMESDERQCPGENCKQKQVPIDAIVPNKMVRQAVQAWIASGPGTSAAAAAAAGGVDVQAQVEQVRIRIGLQPAPVPTAPAVLPRVVIATPPVHVPEPSLMPAQATLAASASPGVLSAPGTPSLDSPVPAASGYTAPAVATSAPVPLPTLFTQPPPNMMVAPSSAVPVSSAEVLAPPGVPAVSMALPPAAPPPGTYVVPAPLPTLPPIPGVSAMSVMQPMFHQPPPLMTIPTVNSGGPQFLNAWEAFLNRNDQRGGGGPSRVRRGSDRDRHGHVDRRRDRDRDAERREREREKEKHRKSRRERSPSSSSSSSSSSSEDEKTTRSSDRRSKERERVERRRDDRREKQVPSYKDSRRRERDPEHPRDTFPPPASKKYRQVRDTRETRDTYHHTERDVARPRRGVPEDRKRRSDVRREMTSGEREGKRRRPSRDADNADSVPVENEDDEAAIDDALKEMMDTDGGDGLELQDAVEGDSPASVADATDKPTPSEEANKAINDEPVKFNEEAEHTSEAENEEPSGEPQPIKDDSVENDDAGFDDEDVIKANSKTNSVNDSNDDDERKSHKKHKKHKKHRKHNKSGSKEKEDGDDGESRKEKKSKKHKKEKKHKKDMTEEEARERKERKKEKKERKEKEKEKEKRKEDERVDVKEKRKDEERRDEKEKRKDEGDRRDEKRTEKDKPRRSSVGEREEKAAPSSSSRTKSNSSGDRKEKNDSGSGGKEKERAAEKETEKKPRKKADSTSSESRSHAMSKDSAASSKSGKERDATASTDVEEDKAKVVVDEKRIRETFSPAGMLKKKKITLNI